MLIVLFNIDIQRFGLDARVLTEILPAVPLQEVYGSIPGVAGMLLHQDAPIPVIDIGWLTTGRPCPPRLSTRILIFDYKAGPPGARLGLRVENANDAEEIDEEAFIRPGFVSPTTPYLAGILRRGLETIQLINLDRLLSAEVRACLYPESSA